MAEFEEVTVGAVSPKGVVEKAPVEEETVAVEVVDSDVASVEPDHKRKHEYDEVQTKVDQTEETGVAPVPSEVDGDGLTHVAGEKETDTVDYKYDECNEPKRQKLLTEPEPETFDDCSNQKNDQTKGVHAEANGTVSTNENSEQTSVEKNEKIPPLVFEQENKERMESNDSSRKIIVANAKVGVLIGKSGDTIRLLQHNSGAKIQITRDSDADPNVPTRSVELIGTLESINKAEKLIKDVIAEADAGGSPALVARGFGTPKSGAEQLEIQVPNDKVGLIIGKGGDTIKSLQTRSGARIQLIPQHLPEGDTSKSRIVRISGNKKQIEIATEMVEEVMNQLPGRPSPYSGPYSQKVQRHQVQGPPPPHWGPRAMHPQHATGYDYQQRGMYSSQNQYPSSYGGGYQQQQPPRGGYGGWDQRNTHTPSQSRVGYDNYGHGGPPVESQPSHHSGPPANYYGQPQGPGYGQPTPYPPPVSSQHNYGQAGPGYVEPKYDNQPQSQQQMYGPQQPGPYSQLPPQSGYQPPYNRPNSGVPSHVPQSYGQPRPNLSADQMYQAPTPSGYGSVPSQQPYPYGPGAQAIPAAYNQPYGGSVDGGYVQQPSSGYPQQGGPVPQQGFAPTGQVAPTTYPHVPAPAVGYNQYPQPAQAQTQPTQTQVPSQPSYNEQPVPTTAYVAPVVPTAQTVNVPTPNVVNPTGYDQPAQAQPVYGNYPPGSGASVGYT